MESIIGLYEKSKEIKTWKLASDKVISGNVCVVNNLGEKKVWSLKWLAEKVSTGDITENKDGSFQFVKTTKPDVTAF